MDEGKVELNKLSWPLIGGEQLGFISVLPLNVMKSSKTEKLVLQFPSDAEADNVLRSGASGNCST